MLQTSLFGRHPLFARVLVASVFVASGSSSVKAQSPSVSKGSDQRVGLLIVAHGADSGWNAKVRNTVSQVTWSRGPMAVAFLMGAEAESASWTRGVDQLASQGAERIVAVPLMVSTHGSHVDQIRFYAGELSTLPKELEAMMAQMGHAHTGHLSLIHI